jgi:hypothetical protein
LTVKNENKGKTVSGRVDPRDHVAVSKMLDAGDFKRFGITNESQLIKGLYYRIARKELKIK